MCYCPDLSSKQAGYNIYTGASGLGYYHYLRGTGSFVLPNRTLGSFSFGCHFEAGEEALKVRPWDGVGRHIVIRQIGAEFELSFGRFIELRLDPRKRWFEAEIENHADKAVSAELTVTGLWGVNLEYGTQTVSSQGGKAVLTVQLEANAVTTIKGKVKE